MKATHFTWGEFLTAATLPTTVGECSGSIRGTRSFTGTDSFEQAVGLAMNGWADGLAQMDAEFRRLQAALPCGDDVIPRFTEAGDEVDVGLFLDGDPENMIEYTMAPARKPVVKIVVSVTFSGGIPTESIFRRGAAVMLVVDGLESAGVRVEVVVDFTTNSRAGITRRTIMVKAADDAMDRDRLVFAICHPSMLRRLCFRLNETEGMKRWQDLGGDGYGMPENPEPDDNATIFPMMSYAEPKWRTPESAAAEAKRIIDEITSKA